MRMQTVEWKASAVICGTNVLYGLQQGINPRERSPNTYRVPTQAKPHTLVPITECTSIFRAPALYAFSETTIGKSKPENVKPSYPAISEKRVIM